MGWIDENEFLTTIDDFNESVKSGADKTCGRTAFDDTCYIKTPPFYTFPITWSMHITLDGIAANENGEVLDEQSIRFQVFMPPEKWFAEPAGLAAKAKAYLLCVICWRNQSVALP